MRVMLPLQGNESVVGHTQVPRIEGTQEVQVSIDKGLN